MCAAGQRALLIDAGVALSVVTPAGVKCGTARGSGGLLGRGRGTVGRRGGAVSEQTGYLDDLIFVF